MEPSPESERQHQVWYCEHCHSLGVVVYPTKAGVFEVYDELSVEHQRAAGECPGEARAVILEAIEKNEIFLRGATAK